MRQGIGSTLVRRARRAVAPVGFVVILVAGMVGLVGPAGARPGVGGPRTVEVTTNHAKVEACSFDGVGTPCSPVVKEASDFSAFIESVSDFDDPSARATSELSITFEVTDAAVPFSLTGAIDAAAGTAIIECSTVIVTSPSGAVFGVSAPVDCVGPESLPISEVGKLQPGTHTLSVVAEAVARNPNASGPVALVLYNLSLSLGCEIIGTADVDVLVGTDDDAIAGEGGDDHPTFDFGGLFGGPGDDHIDGGEGIAYIEGGTGNDILGGGGDTDFIFGDDAQGCDGALSDPGLDDDEIFGGGGNDLLFGCQGLDKISGEGGDDQIDGKTGNDVLRGNAGSDKLHGNDGSDTLTGGTRKDVLLGDGDNDKLFAADGVLDVVRGGPGGGDEARIDEGVDTVTGVEVFL